MSIIKKVLKFNVLLLGIFLSVFLLTSCESNKNLQVELILSADKTIAFPTETVKFTTLINANTDDPINVTYEIISGYDLATISNEGVLTVKESATNGGSVSVVSKCNEFKSNEVSVEIGINVISVTASANKTTLSSGNAISLKAEVMPTNATNSKVEWHIVEGDDFGVVSGNVLIVNDNVGVDKVIKVKASVDGVDSNILTFIINPFVLDLHLELTSDKIKAYKDEMVTFTTTVTGNSDDYEDPTYEIVEGNDLATISKDGVLTVTSNDGGKVVVVSKIGDFVSNKVEITLGIKVTSVTAEASDYELTAGESISLNSTVLPASADNKEVVWEVVEGSQYCFIVGNVLMTKGTAEVVTIKVKATSNGVSSNILTFTVTPKNDAVKLTLSADKNLAYPAGTIQFNTVVTSDYTVSKDPIYTIISGDDLATIDENGLLTIKDSATNGGTVIVVSKIDNFTSNQIAIEIGIRVNSVKVSTQKTVLASGNTAQLFVEEIKPANATNKLVTWTIIEGNEYGFISGTVLVVNDNVGTDKVIKVKATVDGVDSNILEFTINPFVLDLKLELTSDKIKAYKDETVTFTAVVTGNSDDYEDVTYEIVSGAELATITADGVLTITSNAGGKVVVVSKTGEFVSNKVEITLGIKVTSVTAEAIDYELTAGDIISLESTVLPENADDKEVKWEIVDGAAYCSIVGNVLMTKGTAEVVTIKAKATSNGVSSNILTFTVTPKNDAVKLTLSADKNLAYPAGTIQFSTVVTSDYTVSKDPIYTIVSGADLATIDENGLLTIKDSATNGGTIIVASKIDNFTSNQVAIEIGIRVTSVKVSTQKELILAGDSSQLFVEINPTNATNKEVTWSIVEGDTLASILGNTLVINVNTKSGSIIKVKATVDGVDSNVLEFTVDKTDAEKEQEANKEKFTLSLNYDVLNIDKYGTSTTKLIASIIDGNLDEVIGKNVTFEVETGASYVNLSPNGLECSFEAIGHGEAKIKVTIEETDIVEYATINSIVPPTALKLHDVFAESQSDLFKYNFGIGIKFGNDTKDSLHFPITPVGTNVCTDYEVTFLDSHGNTGDTVATYDYTTQKITFNKTGDVTVIVKSTSGSKNEVSQSFTFSINNGINVYSYEDFVSTLRSKDYKGEIVNVVVLEKPVDNSSNQEEYGYELVPLQALKDKDAGVIEAVINNELSALLSNKGAYINGNNHTINISRVPILTKAEVDKYNSDNSVSYPYLLWSVLYFNEGKENIAHQINIYDLHFKGQSGVTYGRNNNTINQDLFVDQTCPIGVFARAIRIGDTNEKMRYYVDMDNIKIESFYIGLELGHVADATISNLSVNDCFANGIQCGASIVEFNNLEIGACGATGIELGKECADAAGIGYNQNQSVTFNGNFSISKFNEGNTVYFENYKIGLGGQTTTIPMLIKAVVASLTNVQASHVCNEKGEFGFIVLIFNDVATNTINPSVVQYKGMDDAGIIKASEITEIDTTHKYIELDVVYGSLPLGKALLYNHNYVKTVE